ncbi:DUF58 domain-containing protein [Falsibacillus pallidus]|uniref:Uncharacterized protein (DUF58 family) n=1 Tax=Falsibacillus pallidus TaxID=493781 RepID=A0A370GWM7_9BACI|nr:DUF58 domain-containing protein [Falsibacillus pallidus]RDI47660.1 uncharacterized protein (DUF58 family) [Falsibacillus pallidus]
MWKTDINGDRILKVGFTIFLLFAIITFFTYQYLLMSVFLLFLLFIQLDDFYLRKVPDSLKLKNQIKKEKLNPGDLESWKLVFENHRLPILNGQILVQFDENVIPMQGDYHSIQSLVELTIPFSILPNQRKEIEIPIEAVERGISKLRKIEVTVNGLLGGGSVLLEYAHILRSEILVYPARNTIHQHQDKEKNMSGLFSIPASLFEDPLQPIGTRDYTSSDSFQHIHWKASARMSQLQTKVFAKTTQRSWMIALNISDGYSISNELELMIRQCAQLIDHAFKNGIPFALVVNIRSFGQAPYFSLGLGEGQKQWQRALEMLAMISQQSFTIPFSSLLSHQLGSHIQVSSLICFGEVAEKSKAGLTSFHQKGIEVYCVKNDNGQGAIIPWNTSAVV